MRKFRLLQANEVECRVARQTAWGIELLLYKTARTDAALLDETYPDLWQCDFKALDGKMYGGIGIKVNDEWLWRWDCGSESNVEAEKGEASDAFKRAGFKWGIGTELYSSPKIIVKEFNTKDGKLADSFRVTNIGYDAAERVCELDIESTYLHKSVFHYSNVKKTDNSLAKATILKLAEMKGKQNIYREDGMVTKTGLVPWDEATSQQYADAKTYLQGLPNV